MEKIKTIRETSELVVKQMLNFCPFTIVSNKILEPSAGKGILLDHVKNLIKKSPLDIDCVELNKENREILKLKGYNVIGEDFLKMKPTLKTIYDYIIATPTYKNNIDVEHIMHMYKFLKVGGSLVSLTHPAWTTHNNENQVIFREWLKNKNYSMKMLEDNSFIENYETQPSMIIKITKEFRYEEE